MILLEAVETKTGALGRKTVPRDLAVLVAQRAKSFDNLSRRNIRQAKTLLDLSNV
ncbi:MAG: hypothetical protein ABJA64_03360 [Candidatus Saccharibacteria bacterium]